METLNEKPLVVHQSLRERLESSPIDKNVLYYWGYMYDLSVDYMLDYLEKNGIGIEGKRIVEIGSAEGGNLCAMAERGAKELVGTDIAEVRLDSARQIAEYLSLEIEYSSNDIINDEQPSKWLDHFDIALLRDVIEHLDDPTAALKNIKNLLTPAGHLYVTFPPWYSPFGGHQQLLMNWVSKIPYVHFLPKPLFKRAIRSGRPLDVVEVERLRNIRMTTGKFKEAAKDAGFTIVDQQLFFLRPVFRSKFGLPTIGANFMKPFPGIKELFVLEAAFLLKAE